MLQGTALPQQRHALAGSAPVAARAPAAARAAAPPPRTVAAGAAGADVEAAKAVLDRAAAGASSERFDARAFRRSLNKSGRYTRQPSNDADSLSLMEQHGVGYSTTGLVAQMREAGNVWRAGGVEVRLAEAYGFCWGVERAVQMAYEARRAYPGRPIHITNEIIHNPSVNARLKEMGVQFIPEVPAGADKDFSAVQRGDVVILPAFGASVQEMRTLHEREVQIVDTTCPWVSKVWNAVDNQARKGHTSIIHGKWAHEETVATASFAGTFLIVKDLKEAQFVCDYILSGCASVSKDEFLARFHPNAMSAGFDPTVDLDRVGMANQTTMLKGETEAIGKLLERTMMQAHGPAALGEHFMVMDTICDATQERQDAVYALVGRQADPAARLDLLLVVGGFNSSNTSHLAEIGEHAGIPTYWVDCADRVDVAANAVAHKMSGGEMREARPWLGDGPLRVGVTSGASTPDAAVEAVLDRLFRIKVPGFTGVPPRKTNVKKVVQH